MSTSPLPSSTLSPALTSLESRQRTAVVLRADRPLHVGDALQLRTPLQRLRDRPLDILVLDFDHDAPRRPLSGLTDSSLDRLACLPTDAGNRVGLATAVPSIACLAAAAASRVAPPPAGDGDPTAWFRDLLLGVSLLAFGRDNAVCECESPRALLGARRAVSRLARALPGRAGGFPQPLLSGLGPFLSLDGPGVMGSSERGALYLSDSADQVRRKIRTARTDNQPLLDPDRALSAEVANLLLLLHATSGEPVGAWLERLAGRGYGDLKQALADAVNAYLEPLRRRREALVRDEAGLARELREGARALERQAELVAFELTRAPVAAA